MLAGEDEYRLNCCFNDEPDRYFSVIVPREVNVDGLKGAIKKENPQTLGPVETTSFHLWKVSIAEEELDSKLDDIRGLVGGTKLRDLVRLSRVFSSDPPKREHLHIIVQRPIVPVSFRPPRVVFKLSTIGSLGGEQDAELNEIFPTGRRPSFITNFISRLRRKRKISTQNPHANAMKAFLRDQFHEHFDEIPSGPMEMSINDDTATPLELLHYLYLCGSEEVESRHLEGLGKEKFVYLWINLPAIHLERVLDESQIAYRKAWAFPIVGEHNNNGTKNYYKYTPRNDFHLSVQRFPYLLLGIVSDEGNESDDEGNESDRYRMLIQASCIARLANDTRKPNADPFVVMAIFFSGARFDRYLLYQPDNSAITTYYFVETFMIRSRYQNFLFLFELYNYASVARRLQEDLSGLDLNALNASATTLQSLFVTTVGGRKRARENDGIGSRNARRPPGPPGPSQSGDRQVYSSVFDDPIVRSELSSAGYNVAEAFVELGMEPFDRISPTVSIATRTNNGRQRVVLKFIDASSSELRILECLAALTSRQNHTVALLQTIQTSCGPIVAFPCLQPLPRCTPKNEENVLSLTRQFVQGVSFMHGQSVAHLDLKPDNILVNTSNPPRQLWITDFSLSVLVNDEDEMIEGYAGTPGWTAPEIGDEDSPPQKYSPIRADRWSCGQMIQYFGTFGPGFKDPELRGFSQLLLNEDPSKRPDLIDHLLQVKGSPVPNPKATLNKID